MTAATPQAEGAGAGLSFEEWNVGATGRGEPVKLLPDPPRQERHFTIVSVDDHIVEPPTLFEGRMPARFEDLGPRIVDLPAGGQAWLFDGHLLENIGLNAIVGRPVSSWSADPTSFDEMRKGTWDIDARIEDMDLDGTYASLNFGSFLPGFAGTRLQTVTKDRELALAAIRAWNDWHLNEWAGKYPDRIIPCQLPWLHDPELAAQEIRRNADLGFKAVSFPEAPDLLGWPSIHTSNWEPIFRACAETQTVVCVHVGSGGQMPPMAPGAPKDVGGVLFGTYAMMYTVEWLFSRVAVRHPNLKICISEGGIGWVAALYDRLDHVNKYQEIFHTWDNIELTPAEILRRNFYFCALDDPSAWVQLDRIGVDRVLVEVDYPHADTSWPHTQASLSSQLATLSADAIDKVTWRNASELFRHDIPVLVQRDPNSF
jgi:predicted TIM-barrel fold metal-dependent hydrolase